MKNITPQIISLDTIKSQLATINVFDAVKDGFTSYSNNEAVIPPVGELVFDSPPGDVHIKYGYIKSQPYYVVKIASGFYNNPELGIPSSQGMNLLFDKQNGLLRAILLDEGYLTDVRTAVAGALASQLLANKDTKTIGIVGAGIQARYQIEYHKQVFPDARFMIWNRDPKKAQMIVEEFVNDDIRIQTQLQLKLLCESSQVIVTTTPSSNFLISKEWVTAGTHITAIGSDTAHKIELDPELLGRAEVIVVDSLAQSESRGEVYRSVEANAISRAHVLEFGKVLKTPALGRSAYDDISIADLTGVAVQDLMISQAVFDSLNK